MLLLSWKRLLLFFMMIPFLPTTFFSCERAHMMGKTFVAFKPMFSALPTNFPSGCVVHDCKKTKTKAIKGGFH